MTAEIETKIRRIAKIESDIIELGHMVDGINIALERARELREKLLFSGQQETLGLDSLIELLRKDKAELRQSKIALRKEL